MDEDALARLVDIPSDTTSDTRDALWPGADIAEAGFNLLLVHLDEIVQTGRADAGPLRITDQGIETAEAAEETSLTPAAEGGPFEIHLPTSGDTYPKDCRGR